MRPTETKPAYLSGNHHLPSITQTPSNKAADGISALFDNAITQHMKGLERSEHTSQYSDTLKNLQFRSVSTTSSQSHMTAANDACPQAANHNHLKAALTRYVERKENAPIPLSDYKVLLNHFHRPLPEMDLSKLGKKDFEIALRLPDFSLDKIPVDRRTKQMCVIACSKNPANLKHLPEKFKNSGLYQKLFIAGKPSGLTPSDFMPFVPKSIVKEWVNNGFLKTLFMKDAHLLHYIPKHKHTDDMLAHACKTTARMAKFIPKDHPKRNEWLLSAFEIDRDVIRLIPKKMITLEMSQSACERDGHNITYIPDQHKTFNMYSIACKTAGLILQQLPSWLTDTEREQLYHIAVASNTWALRFIPEESRSYELCRQACQHSNSSLIIDSLPQHLSRKQLTELYKIACISTNFIAFEDIPDNIKTDDFLKSLLNCLTMTTNNDCMTYFNIEDKYKTADLFNIAIKKSSPKFISNMTGTKIEVDSLAKLPYIPISLQFKLLTDSKRSIDDKLGLIDVIDRVNHQPHALLPSSN